jgi:hypothetical protein
MALWPFKREELITVSEALDIAEDKIGDYYKLSAQQWKRHRYDVKTLTSLDAAQIVPDAFAFLDKGVRVPADVGTSRTIHEYYFICLQDHHILEALNRDRDLQLLPLLVYIFTHELTHIVRFGSFLQRFEMGREREKEEKIVHGITHDILRKLAVPRMEYVLDSYRCHRPGGFLDIQIER